jgi:hypothetical protein
MAAKAAPAAQSGLTVAADSIHLTNARILIIVEPFFMAGAIIGPGIPGRVATSMNRWPCGVQRWNLRRIGLSF